MAKKKIFILMANPDKESFSKALADAYVRGAVEAGHDVRMSCISDMAFDPILHRGYKAIQELEPDLVKFQEDVRWSDHFVTVFPIWWSNMPALFKGLVDRVWLPGFAFNFRKGRIPGWHRRLRGRSARVIITSDSHPIILWTLFGGNVNSYTRGVLRFSGFAPMRRTWFSGIKNMSEKKGQKLLKKVSALGRKGK